MLSHADRNNIYWQACIKNWQNQAIWQILISIQSKRFIRSGVQPLVKALNQRAAVWRINLQSFSVFAVSARWVCESWWASLVDGEATKQHDHVRTRLALTSRSSRPLTQRDVRPKGMSNATHGRSCVHVLIDFAVHPGANRSWGGGSAGLIGYIEFGIRRRRVRSPEMSARLPKSKSAMLNDPPPPLFPDEEELWAGALCGTAETSPESGELPAMFVAATVK